VECFAADFHLTVSGVLAMIHSYWDRFIRFTRPNPNSNLSRDLCEAKRQLIDEYETATDEYLRTVRVLKRGIGIDTREDYEEVRTAVERTRARSEETLQELDNHIWEHGCC